MFDYPHDEETEDHLSRIMEAFALDGKTTSKKFSRPNNDMARKFLQRIERRENIDAIALTGLDKASFCKAFQLDEEQYRTITEDIRKALLDANILGKTPSELSDEVIDAALIPVVCIHQKLRANAEAKEFLECLRGFAAKINDEAVAMGLKERLPILNNPGGISSDIRIQVLCNGNCYFIQPVECAIERLSPATSARFFNPTDLSYSIFMELVERKVGCSFEDGRHMINWASGARRGKIPTNHPGKGYVLWQGALRKMLEGMPVRFEVHPHCLNSQSIKGTTIQIKDAGRLEQRHVQEKISERIRFRFQTQ